MKDTCRFAGEARNWTAGALSTWDGFDRRRLKMVRPISPVITLFDDRCVYRLVPDPAGDLVAGPRRYRTAAEAHDGEIALPDGQTVPAGRLAFAAPLSDGGVFFTMALPSLWRANTAEARDPDRLAMVVFMHEFSHTQQAEGLNNRVDDLIASGLDGDAGDDAVQARFGGQAGYDAAFQTELTAVYAVSEAPTLSDARRHLSRSLELIAARRARWFVGDAALYAEADDLFLTLEGIGNWASWVWLTDPDGGRLSPAEATAFVRGGRRWWSQDEGLGLMLAIDRLTPDWPVLAFGPDPLTIDGLAARALQPSRSSE
ncbi:hypothetical protein [Brevundimonas subvibrioides]|uniref:hypothetical protein n=1 Tax=Brevundimonas subvibrioides TaxID=74313 RepID=UPI0032D58A35